MPGTLGNPKRPAGHSKPGVRQFFGPYRLQQQMREIGLFTRD
jgi:hypothetical protein